MLEVAHSAGFFANLAYFSASGAISQNVGLDHLQVVDSAGHRERLKRLPR
jgi:hypothetical protein